MPDSASHHFNATRLDVRAFAHSASTLPGSDLLSRYERLAQDLRALTVDWADRKVSWQLRGEGVTPTGGHMQVWLHLQAQVELPLTCQRCMGTVDVPVSIDNHYRFVANEEAALAEDEVSEEDVLVLSKQFDAHALLEDELLMAVPIVPKHDVCPKPVKLASTDDEFKAALTQKPNAFAALGSLKKLQS